MRKFSIFSQTEHNTNNFKTKTVKLYIVDITISCIVITKKLGFL